MSDRNEVLDMMIDATMKPIEEKGYLDGFQLSETARQELRNKIMHMIVDRRDVDWMSSVIVSYLRGYKLGKEE